MGGYQGDSSGAEYLGARSDPPMQGRDLGRPAATVALSGTLTLLATMVKPSDSIPDPEFPERRARRGRIEPARPVTRGILPDGELGF